MGDEEEGWTTTIWFGGFDSFDEAWSAFGDMGEPPPDLQVTLKMRWRVGCCFHSWYVYFCTTRGSSLQDEEQEQEDVQVFEKIQSWCGGSSIQLLPRPVLMLEELDIAENRRLVLGLAH